MNKYHLCEEMGLKGWYGDDEYWINAADVEKLLSEGVRLLVSKGLGTHYGETSVIGRATHTVLAIGEKPIKRATRVATLSEDEVRLALRGPYLSDSESELENCIIEKLFDGKKEQGR